MRLLEIHLVLFFVGGKSITKEEARNLQKLDSITNIIPIICHVR
jgi:septin family protein